MNYTILSFFKAALPRLSFYRAVAFSFGRNSTVLRLHRPDMIQHLLIVRRMRLEN